VNTTLYLGCPLWGQKTWVGNFFPKGTKPAAFLSTYSRNLNAVEGNTTFYALPDAATVTRWRDETPVGFRFCLKMPQTISHHKRLVNTDGDTDEFVDRLRLLGERCGPAFLQLPPTFSAKQLTALERFLQRWPRDLKLAVEPRHADFFAPSGSAQFNALLAGFDVARCEFDTRGLRSVPPSHSPIVQTAQQRKPNFAPQFAVLANQVFVRFCGHPVIELNRAWLAEWATHIAAQLAQGNAVYFFAHHPDDTHAPAVARQLHGLVSRLITLPPLPTWGELPAPAQPSLFG
jgi:uncharacterized protein YecE (DUF72 family)